MRAPELVFSFLSFGFFSHAFYFFFIWLFCNAILSLCSMVSSNIFFCLILESKGCHCSESCSSAILISKLLDSAESLKKTMRSKPHRLGNKNGFIFGTYSVCCRLVNFKYEASLLLLIATLNLLYQKSQPTRMVYGSSLHAALL